MPHITVFQTDNRPVHELWYLQMTMEVNKKACDLLGYKYIFKEMLTSGRDPGLHPATQKIIEVSDFINSFEGDDCVLVFLDSDAWIQNPRLLSMMIDRLVATQDKHGCFSRDPYMTFNTYINSGSFIIKINEFTKTMYKHILSYLEMDTAYLNKWPWDQHYISKYIFNFKEYFNIYVPDIINTPYGKVIRHNWLKNIWLHHDIGTILKDGFQCDNDSPLNFEEVLDSAEFPNVVNSGPTYSDYPPPGPQRKQQRFSPKADFKIIL